ncbi:unnamed protein product [Prorocentrum cordatum]|uniref:Uncharacterized protein n=1 Tax=Prorocentrum cordatum TaxID=2364126 RepID=A0ABN9Y1Y1_9DINO|nr:unnamed protein product [Polarella glacialis]
MVLRVQEHNLNAKLPDSQSRAAAAEYHRIWAKASDTDGGGTSGGIEIPAPKRIQAIFISLSTCGNNPRARAVAAHEHFAMKGGIIVVSGYLHWTSPVCSSW